MKKSSQNPRRALVIALSCLLAGSCSRTPGNALERGNAHFAKHEYAQAMLEYKNAMQARPDDAEPQYRMALVALATGDNRSGVALLRNAVRLNPKHRAAQIKLAELMAFTASPGLIRQAETSMRDLLSWSPDDTDGLQLLAITEWRLGKADDAEKHLKKTLAKFPGHLQPAIALAWMKLSRGENAAAEQILKDAAARMPESTAPLLALGRFYVILNRWADAEQQFRAVCEREPQNGEALMDLARVQVEKRAFEAAERTFTRLGSLTEPRYRVMLPVFLYQTGRRAEAISRLERMYSQNPAERTFRTLLVSAYVGQNRISDAEDLLRRTLEKNSRDMEARLQRARIRLLNRRWTDAQNDAVYVLSREPKSADAHYLLSRVHAARGETMLAKQELSAALESNPNLLPARADLARQMITERQPQAALQLMNETPRSQAGLLPAITERNWALLAVRNMTEARASVSKALAQIKAPDLLLQDAVLKLDNHDTAGARKSLEQALALRGDDVRVLQALAGTYSMEKQGSEALRLIKEAASRHPDSVAVQDLCGRWLFDAGDYAGARRAWARVKELQPDPVYPELMLAQIDQAEGDLTGARARLMRLTSLPSATAAVYFELGNVQTALKHPEEGIRNYRKAIELDPRHVWALNNLAFLLADTGGSADEALKFAQQAVEMFPDSDVTQDTIGWTYYRKGLYDLAVKHLEAATEKGRRLSAQYHLAAAYARAGRRTDAERMLRTARERGTDLPEAALAQEAVESSRTVHNAR